MKIFEINEVLQEDISYYGDLLKRKKDSLIDYQQYMKFKIDELIKNSNEYYCSLLDEGFSEYDAGLYTSEVYDSSYEDVYREEDELLSDIRFAEIRLKISLLANAQIKYMSDNSEV